MDARTTTTRETYTPKGICPQCGYAVDAGTCPECGVTTTEGRLAKTQHARRCRLIHRCAVVLCSVAVLVGACYLVRKGMWLRPVPSTILLGMQGDADSVVTRELMRRFAASALTTEQTTKLLDQAMLPPTIVMLDPLPAGVETTVFFHPYLRIPDAVIRSWDLYDQQCELRVDGELVHAPIGYPGDPGWRWLNPQAGYRLRNLGGWREMGRYMPALSVGAHEITWTKEFTLGRYPAQHTWTLTATRIFVAQDCPLEQCVRAVATPELADHVRRNLYIPSDGRCLGQPPPRHAPVESNLTEMAITGEVWARPASSQRFQHVEDVCFPRGWPVEFYLHFFRRRFRRCASADIQIVPSARVAVIYGYNEYFGQVIEVRNLPLQVEEGEWDVTRITEASVRIVDPRRGAPSDSTVRVLVAP